MNKILFFILKFIIVIAVVGAGVMVSQWLYDTRPKAKKKPVVKDIAAVECITVKSGDHNVVIRAMGTVVPARQVVVKPQVSGAIVEVNDGFVPGTSFKKDDLMVRIESIDYELACATLESELFIAENNLAMEMGKQEIAEKEWVMMDIKEASELEKKLALRNPQLNILKEKIRSIETNIKKAQLNIKRTSIKIPFDSVLISKNIDIGTFVTTQSQIATLVASDEYWVQLD